MNTKRETVNLRAMVDKKGERNMKKQLNDGRKQIVARVPVEVHRAIKVRAAEEGKSVAVIVEKLVREYLRKGAAHA